MTSLKAGDRVRLVGYGHHGTLVDGLKGTVAADQPNKGIVRVLLDISSLCDVYVTPSQCRRLKPKKVPREWILAFNQFGTFLGITGRDLGMCASSDYTVLVKEVIPKKEPK